ncbi:MAG: hypothetical protein IT221_11775 [Fluviicola sp.]|nr:hypothetical protein [Fluviicola sp.]
MKTVLYLLFIVATLFACKKDKVTTPCPSPTPSTPVEYCGVVNPAQNMVWLRDEIEYIDSLGYNLVVRGIYIPSTQQTGFSLAHQVYENLPNEWEIYFYTCDGTYICSYSTGWGGSNCGSLYNEMVYGPVIYQNY